MKDFLNLQIKTRGDEYERLFKQKERLPEDVYRAMAENRAVDVETLGRFLL